MKKSTTKQDKETQDKLTDAAKLLTQITQEDVAKDIAWVKRVMDNQAQGNVAWFVKTLSALRDKTDRILNELLSNP